MYKTQMYKFDILEEKECFEQQYIK